jgi:predicted alpha/beta hydrolase family esterase
VSERRRRFLILHGVENRRPPEHWQYQLAEELHDRGEIVLYPQLPEPDAPRLEDWLELLRGELDQLGSGERIVVCHSLAVMLWIQHANKLDGSGVVDRVLLVAPPSPSALWEQVQPFIPDQLDCEALRASCRGRIRLVCSDNDPYCPEGGIQLYAAPLGLDAEVLPGAGHVTIEDGYGNWPQALKWCIDAATRFAGTPMRGSAVVR